MKIETVINVQDEVLELFHRTKEKYSFNQIEEMIAYAVGLGIQQIRNGTAGTSILSQVVGVEEAAKILKLSPGTIKNKCAAGKIPSKKVGKTWIIDKNSLMKSSE